MKKQRFYPRQVLRRLRGDHQELNPGQQAVLLYGIRRGRRLGISIACGSTVIAGSALRIVLTESLSHGRAT